MARISVPIYENLTIVFGSERKSLYASIRWRALQRQTSNEPENTDYEKANDDLPADGQPERGSERGYGQPFPVAAMLSLPSQGKLVPQDRRSNCKFKMGWLQIKRPAQNFFLATTSIS